MRSNHELTVVVEALLALPIEHELAAVGRLLTEHKVTGWEFMELDESPGRWGYREEDGETGWHWKLRHWRNSGIASKHTFTEER